MVGFLAVRHGLNDFLLEQGGHIGYSVRPSARGRGHASRALGLGLDHAAALGLDRVLLTCEPGNVASQRTIERAGGVYEDTRADRRGSGSRGSGAGRAVALERCGERRRVDHRGVDHQRVAAEARHQHLPAGPAGLADDLEPGEAAGQVEDLAGVAAHDLELAAVDRQAGRRRADADGVDREGEHDQRAGDADGQGASRWS